MISDRIYDDIHPLLKILNMIIPIQFLLYFLTFTRRNTLFCAKRKLRQRRKSLRWPIISDVAPDVGFPSSSQDIVSQILDVIQSDVALYSQVH